MSGKKAFADAAYQAALQLDPNFKRPDYIEVSPVDDGPTRPVPKMGPVPSPMMQQGADALKAMGLKAVPADPRNPPNAVGQAFLKLQNEQQLRPRSPPGGAAAASAPSGGFGGVGLGQGVGILGNLLMGGITPIASNLTAMAAEATKKQREANRLAAQNQNQINAPNLVRVPARQAPVQPMLIRPPGGDGVVGPKPVWFSTPQGRHQVIPLAREPGKPLSFLVVTKK